MKRGILTLALVTSTLMFLGATSANAASAPKNKVYTLGVLTDITGSLGSSNAPTVQGAKAGVALAKSEGYNIKLDVVDTQTSPTAIQTGAKLLVQTDHVDAVLLVSGLGTFVAPYFTQNHVPVVGQAQDGSEWNTSPNMFSVIGANDGASVTTTTGLFMKKEGVTNLGAAGYSLQLATDSVHQDVASAASQGIRAGYVNTSLTYGSVNVNPIALQMKAANVNGYESAMDAASSLALVTALRDAGAKLKAGLAYSYGQDLLNAGPATIQESQGLFVNISWEPMEMHTAATKEFQKWLRAVGVSAEPDFASYSGYTAVDLFVKGLQASGGNTSGPALIKGLASVKNWNEVGLLGNHGFSPGAKVPAPSGPNNCLYFVKVVGSGFQLVSGADPVCGKMLKQKLAS